MIESSPERHASDQDGVFDDNSSTTNSEVDGNIAQGPRPLSHFYRPGNQRKG